MKWTSKAQKIKNAFEANKALAQKAEFVKVFAWWPVNIQDGRVVWLETVFKRMEKYGNAYMYIYYEEIPQ